MCTEAYLAHVEQQIYDLCEATAIANADVVDGPCPSGLILDAAGFAKIQSALEGLLATVLRRQGRASEETAKDMASRILIVKANEAAHTHLTN